MVRTASVAILFAAALGGAADGVLCPEKMDGRRLAAVTFFDGPPAEMASLAPDQESPGRGIFTELWNFPSGSRPVWLVCSYSGTKAVVSRELPRTTKVCTVTYSKSEKMEGLPVIQKVDCK